MTIRPELLESWQQWIKRLATQLSEPQVEALQKILALHYRYRFDPQGIQAKEREQLKSLSQFWLTHYQEQDCKS
jgi:protein-glutamine gamma-glutamyltransferase